MEGFGDIVHGPQGESPDFVLRLVQGADEQDRNVVCVGICFQAFADLIAVHPRHPDVEQDQIGLPGLGSRQGEWPIGHRAHPEPVLDQHPGEQPQVG